MTCPLEVGASLDTCKTSGDYSDSTHANRRKLHEQLVDYYVKWLHGLSLHPSAKPKFVQTVHNRSKGTRNKLIQRMDKLGRKRVTTACYP